MNTYTSFRFTSFIPVWRDHLVNFSLWKIVRRARRAQFLLLVFAAKSSPFWLYDYMEILPVIRSSFVFFTSFASFSSRIILH